MSDNEAANVDDVLGFNLGPDESTSTEPLKPARVSRPRNLKDHHLTSIRGLPYVQKSAQKRVRHNMNHRSEYTNLTNFLNFYQIWGHNLFPKSKFPDFLEMCATTGSERSVKRLRMQYMDEQTGKQRDIDLSESFVPLVDGDAGPSITAVDSADVEAQAQSMSREEEQRLDEQDFEDQMFEQADEARALAREAGDSNTATNPSSTTQTTTTTGPSDRPAEVSQPQRDSDTWSLFGSDSNDDDDFGDDDDFLKDLDAPKKAAPATQTTTVPDPSMEEFDQANFEDDYEAEMEFLREQGL